MKEETTILITKTGPPVAVSGVLLWGYPLSDYVLWITAFWVLLQIGGFVYDRWKKWNDGR